MAVTKTPLQQAKNVVRIPVITENYFRGSKRRGSADMHFINCYPEVWKNPRTGEERHTISKRPGIKNSSGLDSLYTSCLAGLGLTKANMVVIENMCMVQYTDVNVAVVMDTSTSIAYVIRYKPDAGGSHVLIGTIAALATASDDDLIFVRECQLASGGVLYPSISVIRTGANRAASTGWYAIGGASDFSAATLTQITAAAFPDRQATPLVCTGPLIQMNGIFYVMCTNGQVWNSGGSTGTPNDLTSWNSLSFINTYADQDNGVMVARYKHHIIAVSHNSIEFFNDTGNTPPASPLERTDQALIRFGCPSARALINVHDTMYWIASSSSNLHGLFKLDGYTPVKVSSPKEDSLISRVPTNYNSLRLVSLWIQGKIHIGIHGAGSTRDNSGFPAYPYTSVSTKYGSSTDSCYSVEGVQNRLYMKWGSLWFNVDDNIWWSWMSFPGVQSKGGHLLQILPAANFNGSTLATSADTWSENTAILYTICKPSDNWPYTSVDGTTIYRYNPSDSNFLPHNAKGHRDFLPGWGQSHMSDDSDSVTAVIQFSTADFGVMARKKIDKVELVFADVPFLATQDSGASATYDSFSYSMSLFYDRLNQRNFTTVPDNMTLERVAKIPPYTTGVTTSPTGSLNTQGYPDRFYWNNLGMGRYWNFCVVCRSNTPFPLEALEVTINQCTN